MTRRRPATGPLGTVTSSGRYDPASGVLRRSRSPLGDGYRRGRWLGGGRRLPLTPTAAVCPAVRGPMVLVAAGESSTKRRAGKGMLTGDARFVGQKGRRESRCGLSLGRCRTARAGTDLAERRKGSFRSRIAPPESTRLNSAQTVGTFPRERLRHPACSVTRPEPALGDDGAPGFPQERTGLSAARVRLADRAGRPTGRSRGNVSGTRVGPVTGPGPALGDEGAPGFPRERTGLSAARVRLADRAGRPTGRSRGNVSGTRVGPVTGPGPALGDDGAPGFPRERTRRGRGPGSAGRSGRSVHRAFPRERLRHPGQPAVTRPGPALGDDGASGFPRERLRHPAGPRYPARASAR
ncbi:hypothetical protein BKA15_002089 [Microlunatus parietis]|uniref:Uncharacterized protein n=1 Tax=Microlunatus parietis TaxID=682979 RepID=A0A7Y9I5N1_9ACTN|nr:hypothetical protein [Microlunatus parietis]